MNLCLWIGVHEELHLLWSDVIGINHKWSAYIIDRVFTTGGCNGKAVIDIGDRCGCPAYDEVRIVGCCLVLVYHPVDLYGFTIPEDLLLEGCGAVIVYAVIRVIPPVEYRIDHTVSLEDGLVILVSVAIGPGIGHSGRVVVGLPA